MKEQQEIMIFELFIPREQAFVTYIVLSHICRKNAIQSELRSLNSLFGIKKYFVRIIFSYNLMGI